MIGHSAVPQVSAVQCTNPEPKSAAMKPTMNAANARNGFSAIRGAMLINSQAITSAYPAMLAISKFRTARLYASRKARRSRCRISRSFMKRCSPSGLHECGTEDRR